MKENLKNQHDSALSLEVFNIESLYLIRHTKVLKNILKETYTYTKAQWNELLDDLQHDLEHIKLFNGDK